MKISFLVILLSNRVYRLHYIKKVCQPCKNNFNSIRCSCMSEPALPLSRSCKQLYPCSRVDMRGDRHFLYPLVLQSQAVKDAAQEAGDHLKPDVYSSLNKQVLFRWSSLL